MLNILHSESKNRILYCCR